MRRDIPIIMSAPMVQALLREARHPGTGKTMTRRLAWTSRTISANAGPTHYRSKSVVSASPWTKVAVGDRLWVRETWRTHHDPGGVIYNAAGGQEDYIEPNDSIEYAATCRYPKNFAWRSPIHMPRSASRLTLIVTTTKIERLWDINEADCVAEGIVFETADPPFWYVPGLPHELTAVGIEERSDLMPHAAQCFFNLWKHLHGRDSWNENPEVVALSFTVHLSNIDQMPKKEAA